MHHALYIQEILSNIFHLCFLHRPCKESTLDLSALARTCRAFKEPALDVLWRVLNDLSPLARCLPEASHRSSPTRYSFTRPLTQTEWDILRSYTRRIRSILNFDCGLDWESVTGMTVLNPPTTRPLFPNLRELICRYKKETMPLLHLPLPSLDILDVTFEDPHLFQNSLKSFPNSPNIRSLLITVPDPEDTFCEIKHNYFSRWQNLQTVICPRVAFDMDALVHLSRMPALTKLEFALSATLPDLDSPLVFSNLDDLTLEPESLELISRLLSQARLPAMTSFNVNIIRHPSRQELSSFLLDISTSSAGHTVESLTLDQFLFLWIDDRFRQGLSLDFEDLRPLMAFSKLHHLELDIMCHVGLTDDQLLALASAWPMLEHLQINACYGWNSRGITPDGLVHLLQTCQSLCRIALALDTRGYIQVPPDRAPSSLGLTLPPYFSIHVLDSVIEAESVPALTALFSGLATCCESDFSLGDRYGLCITRFPNVEEYINRWGEVRRHVYDTLNRRRPESGDSDVVSIE